MQTLPSALFVGFEVPARTAARLLPASGAATRIER
jgi:hypothetical protein